MQLNHNEMLHIPRQPFAIYEFVIVHFDTVSRITKYMKMPFMKLSVHSIFVLKGFMFYFAAT